MHIKLGDKLRGKSENEKLVYCKNSPRDIQSKTMGKWRAGQGLCKSERVIFLEFEHYIDVERLRVSRRIVVFIQ